MATNRKRGLTRLALAIGIPYFGWWALVAYINYGIQNSPDARLSEVASENMVTAIIWGIVVPITVLIAGAIAYWVYCGFKPRT